MTFKKNEMAIFRQTKRAVVRLLCGVRKIDKYDCEKLMNVLGLEEMLDK